MHTAGGGKLQDLLLTAIHGIKIMLIAHNAYKFQGCAQIYRNYLPQHIAIHVRKQYLAELNRKRKGGRNAQGDSH